jgi:glycerol-3-phosphate dehydrogenase
MRKAFDVLIIGGGVVGSAVARELSRYRLRIGVLEKELDVCCETSGRNSGVLHAGFNNKPGSKMARFCVEGNRGFDWLARELDIPFKRTGKLVVGFTPEDKEQLMRMKAMGEENGVPGLKIVDKAFIKSLAPCVDGEFAMWSPSTAILDPFAYTIGLAENAAKNGARYFLGNKVTDIRLEDGLYTVTTGAGVYQSRWVINCAGLGSAKISSMLGIDDYVIYPCRGEYFILDQKLGPLLPLPAYPVPNPKEGGLGIHLTPSVDGNVFVGPSSEYIDEDNDYSATQSTMDLLIEDGSRIFPHLKREYFIRNFAGIRPKLAGKSEGGFRDFVVERRKEAPHAVNLVGIESPGLTSAVPLAREVIRLMEEVEALAPNPDFDPVRKRAVSFRDKTPEEQAALIAENPDYGEIVCRCETVTKAEVLAALRNPLGVDTLTGIKYRCRTMMGRCQGGYCQTRVAEIIMEEKRRARQALLYNREGSYLFTGTVRGQ